MTAPKPGSTPERPVWVADVPYKPTGLDNLMDALRVVEKLIFVGYALMTAWEVAKALNPPLKVKQDLFVTAMKKRFEKPVDSLPELPADARAAIYDDLRG